MPLVCIAISSNRVSSTSHGECMSYPVICCLLSLPFLSFPPLPLLTMSKITQEHAKSSHTHPRPY